LVGSKGRKVRGCAAGRCNREEVLNVADVQIRSLDRPLTLSRVIEKLQTWFMVKPAACLNPGRDLEDKDTSGQRNFKDGITCRARQV
jgi:hypothetical protein